MMVKTTVIAEAEINHDGQVERAKQLVDVAKASGADLVKFQCFVADNFIAPGSSFLHIFKDRELTLDDFREIKAHAEDIGITMISTASDLMGLEMIVALDLPVIKLGSTNITNMSLLEGLAATKKPIYLSTGASTLGEIERALDIQSAGTDDITLFHCTVQYPADDANLNLRAITTMQAAFPGTPIGYSDHSIGATAAVAAVTLGATVLEKHFTTDNSLAGPDHSFSANPAMLEAYIAAVRQTEAMLGDGAKRPIGPEHDARVSGRRYLTALVDIPGERPIDGDNIRARRVDVSTVPTADLLPPELEPMVYGWKAAHDIPAGRPLTWDDLKPGS